MLYLMHDNDSLFGILLKVISTSHLVILRQYSEVLLTDFAFEVFQRFNNSKMAEYPGAEYNMSGYGLKTYNPEETKNQWVETCKVGLDESVQSILMIETTCDI